MKRGLGAFLLWAALGAVVVYGAASVEGWWHELVGTPAGMPAIDDSFWNFSPPGGGKGAGGVGGSWFKKGAYP
jgi:hypothetical protein